MEALTSIQGRGGGAQGLGGPSSNCVNTVNSDDH